MAVLQAQTTASNGYFLNSIAALQSNRIAFFSNPVNSLLSYGATPTEAIGARQSGLVFFSYYQTVSLGKYQDYQSSFARFFGVSAYQNNDFLYIKKTDVGVQPLTNSTAESLFVGILLRALIEESNSLLSNVYISLFRKYIEPGRQPLIVTNLVINLYMKIIYESVESSELLNNVMINYTTVLTPNQFNN